MLRGLLDPRDVNAALQIVILAVWSLALASTSLEYATLTINVTWFGAAWFCFAIYPDLAMDWVVPRRLEKEPLYVVVESAMRFLGGINAAMMVLSGLVLYVRHWSDQRLFEQAAERRILLFTFAVGHFSQFVANVPAFVLRFEAARRALGRVASAGWVPTRFLRFAKEPVWPRPDQTILFIFVFDGLFFMLNLHCAMQARDDPIMRR